MKAGELAQLFHETYERMAPQFGYETREASAKPWSEVPKQNRALMVATCAHILEVLALTDEREDEDLRRISDSTNDAIADARERRRIYRERLVGPTP